MRAVRSLVIALCASAIALSACSSKDPEPSAADSTVAPLVSEVTETSVEEPENPSTTSDEDATATTRKATTTTRAQALAGRISDPQVAADRLVAAWIDGDRTAARKLTTTSAVVDQLFAETAPDVEPPALPCSLYEPGAYACAYTLAERAELTLVVTGGASAGYFISGLEFGD